MAKESSFDVVSTVDMQEVDNAFQQAKKELAQRYDLKDSGAEIALDKAKQALTVSAPSDFVARQVIDVIGAQAGEARHRSGRREVGRSAAGRRAERAAEREHRRRHRQGHGRPHQQGHQGDEAQGQGADRGRQAARAASASRDTLQEVIAFLKGQDYGQPLQYVNYR